MTGRSEEADILRLLYTGAARDGWSAFLDALARLTRARAAALLIDTGAGPLSFTTAEAPPLPSRDALRAMRAERLYAQSELGLATPLRALRVNPRAETRAWLVISQNFNDFRAADSAQLLRLAPHLGPAVESWLSLTRERAQARQTAALARDLGAGWLWFDAAGRLVDADPQARAMIAAAEGLRLAGDGRFDLADPLRARALRRAMDRAMSATYPPQLVSLGGLELSLFPGLSAPAPGLEPVLRAALRQPPRALARALIPLSEALGLSRSETRLAALLCDGATLAEAAAQLGWTLETARSCSKQIFAQTGARGQSDLIRRLHSGALWFTPD